MAEEPFQYFAFISYKFEDEEGLNTIGGVKAIEVLLFV